MNGPMKMYQTRQIVRHDFPVELPKCMYSLKNIHSIRNGMVDCSPDHVSPLNKKLDIFDQDNHKIPGMAELVVKQEEILKQLDDLKKQILSIKSDLRISSAPSLQSTAKFSSSIETNKAINVDLPDIVIHASPLNPPYSLQILQKLLQDTVALTFSTHLHSSVSALTEESKKLDNSLINFLPKLHVPKINVRLIWKNIGTKIELLVSHVPILGEVNILRFLARAFKSSLNYNSDANCIEIDYILDICYLIVRARTKTEKANLLQTLNKSLGKAQWLVARCQISIADLAAYSAIKQTTNTDEIGSNLGKWFQRCEAVLLS